MKQRQVSVTRTISAPAKEIFDLLADPANHALIDGSGTVRSSRGPASRRLRLGATFGMDMKAGAPYRITNTVVEFEENALIAWRHFAGHRWRWALRELGDGSTEVTETFDWSTARLPVALELTGFPKRNKRAIEKTLRKLAKHFS